MVMSLSLYPDISAPLLPDVPREIAGHDLRKAGRAWDGTAPPGPAKAASERRVEGAGGAQEVAQ